ncbi:MAG: hypothetical protein FWD01_05760, partial [Defluviitaleaceae bacterium]|nr:hypothetical protein [Defluviitaleaceae bacterium]
MDIDKGIYSGNETITWKNISPMPINELRIDMGNISEDDFVIEGIYSGNKIILWQKISPMPTSELRTDTGNMSENILNIKDTSKENQSEHHGNFILICLHAIECREEVKIKIKFSGKIPGSLFHGDDIHEFDRRNPWYPKLYWDEPIGNHYKITFESITEGYQILATGGKSTSDTNITYTEKHIANYYGFAVSKKMTSVSSEIRGV